MSGPRAAAPDPTGFYPDHVSLESRARRLAADHGGADALTITDLYARVDRAVILPNADIGRHARLKNVIVEKGVRIPPGLVVGEDPELDAYRFRRTDRGICLITQPMIDRLSA